jgi:hypothetical protein
MPSGTDPSNRSETPSGTALTGRRRRPARAPHRPETPSGTDPSTGRRRRPARSSTGRRAVRHGPSTRRRRRPARASTGRRVVTIVPVVRDIGSAAQPGWPGPAASAGAPTAAPRRPPARPGSRDARRHSRSFLHGGYVAIGSESAWSRRSPAQRRRPEHHRPQRRHTQPIRANAPIPSLAEPTPPYPLAENQRRHTQPRQNQRRHGQRRQETPPGKAPSGRASPEPASSRSACRESASAGSASGGVSGSRGRACLRSRRCRALPGVVAADPADRQLVERHGCSNSISPSRYAPATPGTVPPLERALAVGDQQPEKSPIRPAGAAHRSRFGMLAER